MRRHIARPGVIEMVCWRWVGELILIGINQSINQSNQSINTQNQSINTQNQSINTPLFSPSYSYLDHIPPHHHGRWVKTTRIPRQRQGHITPTGAAPPGGALGFEGVLFFGWGGVCVERDFLI
jgi:hypothetical protein